MTSPALPAPKSARRTLLLLAAVFFLPFVVGTGLFWSGWRPGKFVNHGELLQPPGVLPPSGLRHVDGRPLPTAELRGKWLLLLPIDGACAAACEQKLQQMQRVHIALNKEQTRVQRVLISSAAAEPALAQLSRAFPDLVVGVVPAGAGGDAWRDVLDGSGQAVYIVDPLGNVMMRYADPADMRGVLKDLERLLKYSWIR
jgi:cytochrome oxidase Cu insertion factor (SCO1/SenC/PrrC family)